MQKLDLCTQNTSTHIIISICKVYLLYRLRFIKCIICVRFSNKSCINGENCVRLSKS